MAHVTLTPGTETGTRVGASDVLGHIRLAFSAFGSRLIRARMREADAWSLRVWSGVYAELIEGAMPDDIERMEFNESDLPIANLLQRAGLVASTSEALRMIRQGAVRIDGERVDDPQLRLARGSEHVYQVGKRRFARVALR